MKFSNRIKSVQPSPIRKLTPYAVKAKKDNVKVYHLNIGQPDIKTRNEFLDAIHNFNEDVIKYSQSNGDDNLINAIIDYYKRYNVYYEYNNVLITNGGSEALTFSIMASCDSGDNVLVFEPFYTNYNSFTKALEVNIKPVTTSVLDSFRLPSKEKLQSQIDEKTKAIIISNPSNPTGTVFTDKEINMIIEIVKENDLLLIADEVYREFCYEKEPFTFASVKEIEQNVVIIDSISKKYSACGARIGSITTKNVDLYNHVLKLAQGRLCVPTLEMIGAAALYKTEHEYLLEIKKEYQKRRDIMCNELSKIEGITYDTPEGAFYIIIKLPIDDSEKFAKYLLTDFRDNNETLMVAPAGGFYATEGLGCNEVRLAYILNTEDIVRATELLKLGIESYKNR